MHETLPPWPRFHARTWYRDRLGENDPGAPPERGGNVDTVVVGAGLAGLSTALELVERGREDVVVVDRGEPGEGASGRNGGFVFGGYSLAPDALARQVGRSGASRMHGWTRDAVALVRSRCERLGVPVSAGEVLLADWFGDDEALDRLRRRTRDLTGQELRWVDRDGMADLVRSDRYGAGLMEPGSFHFNPLEYARAVARAVSDGGGRVAAGCPVTSLQREPGAWRVETPDVVFRAERVVLATGGYDSRLRPKVQRSIQPIGTYIVVTEPLGERLHEVIPADIAVYDTRFAFDYYRKLPDDRLLWGGRISTADRSPNAVQRLMRRDLKRVFPQFADCRFDHAWGGWMSYARHQMPILGEYEPGLWTALGFGGHGMAPTTLAGQVLAEAIDGNNERLHDFGRYPPVWGGGSMGRVAVQCVYWWKQVRDRLQ